MSELERQLAAAFEEVVRAVRDGTAAALRAGRSLAAASRAAQGASDALWPGLRDARRDVAPGAGSDPPTWARARLWAKPVMSPDSKVRRPVRPITDRPAQWLPPGASDLATPCSPLRLPLRRPRTAG